MIKIDKLVSETGRWCRCKKTGSLPCEGVMDSEESRVAEFSRFSDLKIRDSKEVCPS